MIVQQILNGKPISNVITVAPGDSVESAAKVLSDNRIGSVVVSADGRSCVGILSERDIVRELGKRGPGCMADKVEVLMTAAIETCGLADDAEIILTRMTDGRFRHMPVVKDGEMIGIISIGDVVKARLMELAMEKDALQGMIMGH
ncbi:CBS domain-containing protein [Tropicimonas aquimaris]|uniref:CBS domain-containing protein n=1 Tax=Tropicimonas aquimaris TaxID=914152 RepID=A0ABW3IL37_9RHOB